MVLKQLHTCNQALMISPVSTCNQVVMIPSGGTCNQGVTTPPVSACNQGMVIPPVSTCTHVWILNEYVALASINNGEACSWWSWRISDNHPLFGYPTKILVIITNWLTVTKYQYFSNGNRSFTFYLFFFSLCPLSPISFLPDFTMRSTASVI